MTIKNKKTNIFLAIFAICTALASCETKEEFAQAKEENSSDLSCLAKEKEFDNGFSRSSLKFTSKGMQFAWTEGDGMTVYAKGDDKATQLYMLDAGIGSASAKFHADNFQLKENQLYYAFSMIEGDRFNKHVEINNQNSITVYYSGQEQIGNANTTHLGDYDFMAAGTLCKDKNFAHFEFDHLGSTLRVVMAFNDEISLAGDPVFTETTGNRKVKFTEMEIYDSENSFRDYKRVFSFATGTSGDEYSFRWPEQEITSMDRFKLKLRNAPDSEEGVSRFDDYADGSSTAKNQLITYMEIPPIDFSNKKIGVMLKGYYIDNEVKKEVSYVGTYENGFNITNGKAYQINLSMKKPEDFKVTLKINHMWQHGNTQSRSSTGDPGYDKDIFTPDHIYYIYCHDGKVIKPTTATDAQAVTHISGALWNTTNNNGIYISEYKGTGKDDAVITLQKEAHRQGEAAHAECNYHLYVVASQTELTLPELTAGTSEKTVVQTLTYDLPSSGVQTFMRDLYSTPWQETGFVGDIKDPMQDVILYHVAAKVDLLWNSTTAIKSISANNVKNTGLYIFKPTENTGGILSSDGYSETISLTENVDMWKNGRYVLYLPQFTSDCSYKIGLNDTKEDVKFTPVTTGGFTSWLRLLKTQ